MFSEILKMSRTTLSLGRKINTCLTKSNQLPYKICLYIRKCYLRLPTVQFLSFNVNILYLICVVTTVWLDVS